ncbi:uncharacterized protein N0V89_005353 [Didymosphaeria variabile]|uniref:Uncharacterized protein n=1 Tax=Didymosphaeria variabile TaxID=1932322 RepID=A0A9W8XM27_9PLEO|nr:uncharacterized protein N0V89_005353 [Didymosphaeria variabile]KAJ4353623.1 hypothetical protein N0V89_005353 [Didymosphaeria variabile]
MIQERAHCQPSIYIHHLVDEQGIAPTANQYTVIRETVLQYLSSGSEYHELAWLIDNISPPAVRRSATATGHHKYLWTVQRSPSHVQTLIRFCEGVARRAAEVPPVALDQPLPYSPSECGYSVNSHIRLSQHRHRQSSNYVMNLIEDICTYLHQAGTFSQLFRMQPFIVYLIFRPQQAAIAEIFCSGLLQVWIEEGGGLNAYPAGRSVASARRVSAARWVEHERWVADNTEMVRNMRLQKERLEEDVSGLDMEMEEVWREALESENEGDGDDPRDMDYVPDDLAEEFEGLRLEPNL